MDYRLLGSILLIVGTCIGGGMLALPVATYSLGFFGATALLIFCWILMTFSAFLLLEINLWLPLNTNLISMAKATIGPIGQMLTWFLYMLLLYSLLCAYISAGSDLFHNMIVAAGTHINRPVASILFTVIMGSIVGVGIRAVDYSNRLLMLIKFFSYFALIFFLVPYIQIDQLETIEFSQLTKVSALTITIVSFGYAPIVPSLRIYFAGDVKKLKTAIMIGSLIPLLCYIVWDAAIMGIIPMKGSLSLDAIANTTNTTSSMVNTLIALVGKQTVNTFAKVFTSICVVTSFLGVGICLTDFLADGLSVVKKGMGNVLIQCLTFLPPLIIVLYWPGVFIKALEYAGIYCIILLILLPAYMVWRGRYEKRHSSYFKVWGGKPLLVMLFVFSLYILLRSFLQ